MLAIIPMLLPLVSELFGRLIPDPAERDKAVSEFMARAMAMGQAQDQSQAEINKAEAASGDPFATRWRPFIGWICGISIGWFFVVLPIITLIAAAFGRSVALPTVLDDHLWELVTAMLGLGGLRTVERLRGVANGQPPSR
jgi:hypothetical protein